MKRLFALVALFACALMCAPANAQDTVTVSDVTYFDWDYGSMTFSTNVFVMTDTLASGNVAYYVGEMPLDTSATPVVISVDSLYSASNDFEDAWFTSIEIDGLVKKRSQSSFCKTFTIPAGRVTRAQKLYLFRFWETE